MIETALIVGGGIGGLAAALALGDSDVDVRLFEQAPEFGEVGAGIQMGPNMIRALERIGVRERVLADAWKPRSIVMRNALDGSVVTTIALGEEFERRFGAPYAVTHRADLLDALLAKCVEHPRVSTEPNRHVDAVGTEADTGFVRLADGTSAEGDIVVGADGLWSDVRQHVVGDGPPVVSGHIAYRAVLPRELVPEHLWEPDVVLWAGPKTHLVHYPLRGGELFNIVAVFHSDRYEAGWDQVGEVDELLERFSGQGPEVLELLELIEQWKYWVLCDRAPQRPWSKGRVVLIGDAAHPTLQYLAQGAAMAVEDALCLADHLAPPSARVADALRQYEDARVLRTARVQLTSRFYGDAYHAAGVAGELRNSLLGGRPDDAGWEGMAWLYEFAPEWHPETERGTRR